MADDAARLWEKDHGYDANGHQQKTACRAVVDCPVCGKEIELISDTESWVRTNDGRWDHSEYGPAQGVCCDRLIVDSWDACRVYDLSQTDDDDDDDEDDDSDDPERTPLESEVVEEQRQRREAIARADRGHDLGGEAG